MLDEMVFTRIITNECLGTKVTIKGGTPLEVRIKEKAQLAKWSRQEMLHKERESITSRKEQADLDTRRAENTIKNCDSILKINLCSDATLDWASFYNDELLPPFVFKEPPPRYEQVAKGMRVPRKAFFSELLFPSIKKRRLTMEEAARDSFEEQMQDYNARKSSAQAGYETQREAFHKEQAEFNLSIDQLQMDVEKGRPAAVESLVRIALANLELPDEIEMDFNAHFYGAEKLIVVSGILPGPLAIPRVIRFEYHDEKNDILSVEMDKESFDNYYESTLLQITLSAVHRIFTSIPDRQIHMVGFNGLAEEGKSCILTCKVSRNLFNSIDMVRNTPEASFQSMQGIMAKPLTGLTPVEPLVSQPKPTFHRSENGDTTTIDSLQKTTSYRQGDIKNAANNLLVDLLDKLEQDLSKKPGDDDVVH